MFQELHEIGVFTDGIEVSIFLDPIQIGLNLKWPPALAAFKSSTARWTYSWARSLRSVAGRSVAFRAASEAREYAEAFERDADPEDFSLEGMVAHECGHQILARHPRIAKRVAGVSEAAEEILASLLGAMICTKDTDRIALFAKATAELLDRGQNAEEANRQLQQLWDLLEALL